MPSGNHKRPAPDYSLFYGLWTAAIALGWLEFCFVLFFFAISALACVAMLDPLNLELLRLLCCAVWWAGGWGYALFGGSALCIVLAERCFPRLFVPLMVRLPAMALIIVLAAGVALTGYLRNYPEAEYQFEKYMATDPIMRNYSR